MLTTGKIAERVRDLLVLAVRTQDAKARNILIDLACQYQALAGRVAKRGAEQPKKSNRIEFRA